MEAPAAAGDPGDVSRQEESHNGSPESAPSSSQVAEPERSPNGAAASEDSSPGASMRKELAGRVLQLRTLEPMVRACAFVAIGFLALGLLIGLLKHAGLPEAKISAGGIGPISLPLPALVLIVLSFGLAWCYAIAAVLYATPLLRLIILGGFTLAMLDQGTAFSPALESGRAVALVACLVILWAAVLAHGVHTHRSAAQPLGSTVDRRGAAAIFVLAGLIQVLAWWASRATHVPGVFAIGFVLDLTVFALAATVFLASSGGDFAEVADLICSSAADRLRKRRWLLLSIAILTAVGLALRATRNGTSSLAGSITLGVLVVALLVAVSRRQRRTQVKVFAALPSWAPLIAGIIVAGALIVAVAFASSGTESSILKFKLPPPTLVYRHSSAPEFSIAYPPGWSVVDPAQLEYEISGLSSDIPALGQLYAGPWRPEGESLLKSPAEARALVQHTDAVKLAPRSVLISPTSRPDHFDVSAFTAGRRVFRGTVELTRSANYLWMVQVIGNATVWSDVAPIANYMVDTWRPDLTAQPVNLSPPVSTNTPTGVFGLIALGLAAVLAGVLLVGRLGAGVVRVARFLLLAMLLAGLANLREVVALVAGHHVGGVPHLSFDGIEITLALVLVGIAAAAIWKRQHRWPEAALLVLAVIGVAVLLLDFLFNLYANAAGAGVLTAAGVAFLLAAFLWDVLMSGDLTNHDGRLIRRPARVLLYMSYMLAASAATLYFASGHSLGTLRMEDIFSPEAETALSLAFVGVAYVVATGVDRLDLVRGGASPPAGAQTPPARGASAQPVSEAPASVRSK